MRKKRQLHDKLITFSKKKILLNGFSITEVVVATSIIGTLSAIAVPNYMESMRKSGQREIQSKIASIPTIISAYIDATGELPTRWDELSSIAAVMTNDGPATGELTSPIILPNGIYELAVSGPTDSVYTLTATPRFISDAAETEEIDENRFAIQSCFNVSNGASDLKTGNGIENEDVLNCG
ncbi:MULTISPECIES: type IV pilin protein [unclassified Synechococcus]|uniref:type IV pilin protein n=1 Tax=unclassified Synechococcus TaxID=2626047 RepID=UPI0039AF0A78